MASMPLFQNIVIQTLGNWKTNILSSLFSRPKKVITEAVDSMKEKMKNQGYEGFIGVQMRFNLDFSDPDSAQDMNNRFFGCIDYWIKHYPNAAIFVATDRIDTKKEAKIKYGQRLFHFDTAPPGKFFKAHNNWRCGI